MLEIRLSYPPLRLPRGAQKVIAMAAGNAFLSEVKAHIDAGRSFTSRTGKLRKSLRLIPTADDSASIVSDAGYAGFVENGTRAHVIKPRKAKVLYIPGVGFRQFVKHPGSKPYPYILADMPQRDQRMRDAVAAQVIKMVHGS